MSLIRKLPFMMLSLSVATAWGQPNTNEPHIGYLYPAGGQQGAIVQVTVGGQFLRGAAEVHICGGGVHASVVQYMPQLRNISGEQRQLLQSRLKELREKRLAELSENGESRPAASERRLAERQADKPAIRVAGKPETPAKEDAPKTEEVKLPDHPLLYDLENKSIRELVHITDILFASRAKQQPNRQISEFVLIEITIDADAEPGDRELRLRTATGLTNPMVFQVGLLPEVRELEPNNRQAYPELPGLRRVAGRVEGVPPLNHGQDARDTDALDTAEPLDLPVLLNGQIMPGDIDRFRFRASRGQQLVMEVQARNLIPYLADAVPGWFQATLALYDAEGKEVAFADDYRFNPDPVLFYQIPEAGQYELEIRDSIYRGREDFVYRITVSEQPFITQMFPLGGRVGVETVASIAGWNLPGTRLPLDTQPASRKAGQPGGDGIRRTACHEGKRISNSVAYAVDTLPECNETEINDTARDAQPIELPKIINGRIDRPGDVDVFRFEGRAGDKVAVEVYGRRLNSPLDSLLRLTDASGNVLEWNDDHVIEDNHLYKDAAGLLTHHADSYLTAELPKDGDYYVQLADSQHHGGGAYGYRLRVAPAQGDFALRVTPSSISMRAGGIVPVWVHALRKDGFDGEIEMVLKGAPPGFELDGVRIPAGRDRVRITLTAPPKAPAEPVALQLEGRARIGGQTVSRPAVPADDVMQAFLYRHLVPAQEFLVFVQKAGWGVPPVELAGDGPVRIPAGGSAQVQLKTGKRANFKDVQLQLNEPPEGLTMDSVAVVPTGLTFQLKADKGLQSGFADNLIVEAFRESVVRAKDGTPTNQKRRSSLGVFPAIPIEIVQP